MALKAIAIDQGEDAFHLALVVDVFGKNVLVERVAGRSVDEEVAVFAEAARPIGEELPAAFARGLVLRSAFELFARPENRPLRRRVKSLGVEHGALVVIAQQHHLALHDEIDALARIGAIADHVSETIDLGYRVLFDVFEDRLKSLKVAMDIADDCLHTWPSRGGGVWGRAAHALDPAVVQRTRKSVDGNDPVYSSTRNCVKCRVIFELRRWQRSPESRGYTPRGRD